jgi:hypothetical protein
LRKAASADTTAGVAVSGGGDRKHFVDTSDGSEGEAEELEERLRARGEADLTIQRDVWRSTVKTKLLPREAFTEIVFEFNSLSPSYIADSLLDAMESHVLTDVPSRNGGEVNILNVPERLNPRYIVGVKIDRLPGNVSPVRALLCLIYDTGVAGTGGAASTRTVQADNF